MDASDHSSPRKVPAELDRRRIDLVLEALFGERSRAAWQKAVRRGEVLLDGKPVRRSNAIVSRGQRLALRADPRGAERPAPLPDPQVLHADDDLIVLDKPAGWLTHGADRAQGPDLVRFCADRFGALPVEDDADLPRAGIVHRLDRYTSGVIVVARSLEALRSLRNQFRARSVDKRYLALVVGCPREERFRVDLPLRPSRSQADLQLAGEHPDAKPAQTDVALVERYGPVSMVEACPHTGRRHQVRVHLAASELPVVGDPLYRPSASDRQELREWGVALPRGRHALHAARLSIDHPRSGRRQAFEAPLAADLVRQIETLAAR
ncbi:MAG: RluA family pseudouridine synthase [Planctomycetota bacterium]